MGYIATPHGDRIASGDVTAVIVPRTKEHSYWPGTSFIPAYVRMDSGYTTWQVGVQYTVRRNLRTPAQCEVVVTRIQSADTRLLSIERVVALGYASHKALWVAWADRTRGDTATRNTVNRTVIDWNADNMSIRDELRTRPEHYYAVWYLTIEVVDKDTPPF